MNKDLLKLAIPYSDFYSESEKKILQEFVRIAIDKVAIASAKYLKESTRLSTTSVYSVLKTLQSSETITKLHNQSNSYKLNDKKLSLIEELYQNKKAMESD